MSGQRWRRAFLFLAAVVVGAGGWAFLSSVGEKTATPGERRVYRVGYGASMPFHFQNGEGQPDGLAVELVREAARRRGIELEWVNCSPGGFDCIKSGKADFWVLLTIRPERLARVHITAPYLMAETSFLVTDGGPAKTIKSLERGVISLLNFDSHIRDVRRLLPEARQVVTESPMDALQALDEGRVDAAYMNQFTATAITMTRPGGKPLRLLSSGLPRSYYGLASSFEAREGAEAIREEMRVLAQDGTLEALTRRWGMFTAMSTDIVETEDRRRRQTRMLWGGLAVLGFAVVSVGILAWRLHRQKLRAEQQERELRATRERWQLAGIGSNDGIWDFHVGRGEVYYSSRWKEILGYRDEELPNTLEIWENLTHPEDRERVQGLIQAHLRRESDFYTAEYRLRAKDGEYRWVLSRGRAIWDGEGKPVRMAGSLTDITERKRFEEMLREAQSRAEAANVAKSQFLMNMSHEIRTPMNAILGMVELLGRADSEAERQEYIGLIHSSGQSLVELLTQILDVSQIEAKQLKLAHELFSLRDCLHAVEGMFSVVARERGLELRVRFEAAVPEPVIGDSLRLRQVLFNLVGNAMKFTDEGWVAVTVNLAEEPAEGCYRLQFTVEDTGIGIPKHQQALILEAFQQGDNSTTRRHGGSGLGLSICRSLVEAMGGELTFESEPGKGTRFTFQAVFEAPAKEEELAGKAEEEVEQEQPAPPGMRVLVAEDNLVNQKLMGRLLAKEGHHVRMACDGQEAVAACEGEDFDLILMDINMPTLNGLDATRRIREREGKGPRVPIYAVTAAAFACDRKACLEAGMDGFLSKPIDVRELRRAIARAARQRMAVASKEPRAGREAGGAELC